MIQTSFVVNGGKKKRQAAINCVEARVLPSGLNAAAMVDRGGGNNGQYLADKCLNESASALKEISNKITITKF